MKKINCQQTSSYPKGIIHYIISDSNYSSPKAEKRFGALSIYKQKIEEIKNPIFENWRYSLKRETNWESKGFDDSNWEKVSVPLNIMNTRSIIYLRATLNIPEGKKYDRIDVKTNSYLLELYIDGKKRKLPGNRFILTEKGDWQPLIKNLGRVYEWRSDKTESLSSGKYTIALEVLAPKNYLFLDVKKGKQKLGIFKNRQKL